MLVVDLPHPVWVAGDPYFWKSDKLATSIASLIDEGNGFLDASLKIEPARLGGDGCSFILGKRHFGIGDEVGN